LTNIKIKDKFVLNYFIDKTDLLRAAGSAGLLHVRTWRVAYLNRISRMLRPQLNTHYFKEDYSGRIVSSFYPPG